MVTEVDVKTLNEKILNKEDFILIDVRTDSEYYLSNIKHAIHIPMNSIPENLESLDKSKEIIVQCKSGIRSEKVCEFLLNNNYKNVKNLKGGIVAWAKEIDQTIIVY
tara:strand:- start:840 stop:1160 length:321 start_codon:yes stop_codon:yes gene_type:complete